MAIAPPYATSSQVALLQKNLLLGATDFTANSKLPKTSIDQIISWVSAAIDMQLSQAGYLVPLQNLTGEVWPSHQTAWLQLTTCLGTIALISPALKPAPAIGPGRQGSSGNIFQDLYNAELNRIYNLQTNRTLLRFRAMFYRGTPAEKALNEPVGPKADFSRENLASGNVDPNSRLYLWDYTLLQHRLIESFKTNLDWEEMIQLDLVGNYQEPSYDPVTGWQ